MSDDVGVATVINQAPLEIAEARAALSEILEAEVGQPALVSYAGPNETVQLLFNGEQWLRILAAAGALFGSGFIAGLGKNASDDVWKNKSVILDKLKTAAAAPFRRLIMAIVAARSRDQTVTLAVPYPYRGRNAGIVISTNDPVDILKLLSVFAGSASEIQTFLTTNLSGPDGRPAVEFAQNDDLSLKIELGADDQLVLRWWVRPDKPGVPPQIETREFVSDTTV